MTRYLSWEATVEVVSNGIQNQDAEEKRLQEHPSKGHEALCDRMHEHEGC